jgi:hypothetical protein
MKAAAEISHLPLHAASLLLQAAFHTAFLSFLSFFIHQQTGCLAGICI